MMRYPDRCLRDRSDCQPLAQVESDDGSTFVCCGENDGSCRRVEQDKYTFCHRSLEGVDRMEFVDRYDLLGHQYVISRALLMIELGDDNA